MIFGMPYKGSKNAIAQHIIDMLPPADHFYDLFGGGGAVSHCAALSGKFKYIHYNEINPLVFECFVNSTKGYYQNESRWISRKDFLTLKESDPYAAICFSFGNNMRGYAYSEETEAYKHALHCSLFFDDNKLLSNYFNLTDFKYTSDLLSLRYKEIIQFVKRQKPARIMTELQNFEALRRLQALQGLNVSCTCGSYENIEIEKNSVIYCDPPYLNTEGYAHPDDFLCLGSVKKSVIYDPLNKAQKKQEKLYTNEHHEDRFILC